MIVIFQLMMNQFIKILRFDKKIIFSLTFRSADDEYFGTAEFETELSKLKNENKKIEE